MFRLSEELSERILRIRAVAISDFHYPIMVAKRIHVIDIVAISLEN